MQIYAYRTSDISSVRFIWFPIIFITMHVRLDMFPHDSKRNQRTHPSLVLTTVFVSRHVTFLIWFEVSTFEL